LLRPPSPAIAGEATIAPTAATSHFRPEIVTAMLVALTLCADDYPFADFGAMVPQSKFGENGGS
jgi:hypothetical protein